MANKFFENLIKILNLFQVKTAPAYDWQFGFQLPGSPIAEGIMKFHDDLMFFLTFILFFVLYILIRCLKYFTSENGTSERLVHASTLEIIWTVIPAVILVIIAIPSFALLYAMDEMIEPFHTFKVIGHQWYWSYEWLSPYVVYNYLNKNKITENSDVVEEIMKEWDISTMDSYMLSKQDVFEINKNKKAEVAFNLLSVDHYLYLPVEKPLRALISSSDVLHSWAVPSLGVKVDACPGRINQINFMINRVGYYFGQCSEICGINHGFMPIGIYGFYYWDFFSKGLDNKNLDIETLLSCFHTIAQAKS